MYGPANKCTKNHKLKIKSYKKKKSDNNKLTNKQDNKYPEDPLRHWSKDKYPPPKQAHSPTISNRNTHIIYLFAHTKKKIPMHTKIFGGIYCTSTAAKRAFSLEISSGSPCSSGTVSTESKNNNQPHDHIIFISHKDKNT